MQRARLALIALALAGCQTQVILHPEASFVGAWTMTARHPFIGGFSGLTLSPDGREFLLVSDVGYFIRGVLHRPDGAIAGMHQWQVLTMNVPAEVAAHPRGPDPEGLATAAGEVFVALERIHEVWRVDLATGAVERLPQHPEFPGLDDNRSLEALATDASGALFAVPEGSPDGETFPVYRFADGVWTQPFAIPVRGDYLAVGADFGPDGRLYLLERAFRWIGFASRVRRFTVSEAGLADETVLFESATRRHDNLEGLAVWRDAAGDIRLTMVSDDNFRRRLQRSEFVEYRVGD